MKGDKKEILLMAFFSISVMISLSLFFKSYEKKEKQKKGMLFISHPGKEKLMKAYQLLRNNPITGYYILKVTKAYEMLYPDMDTLIAKKSIYTVAAVAGADFTIFIFLFLLKPEMANLITTIIYMYIIQISVLSYISRHIEIKLLTQLDEFLSYLKHSYAASNDLAEALWEGTSNKNICINKHIEKLCKVIQSPDINSEIAEYNETCKIKFLKLLLNICSRVIEQGDSYDLKGEPVFISNLNIMKRDIRKEIEKMKRINFIFSGLTFVIIAPLAALVPIKNWAVLNLSELTQFYDGKNGIYTAAISFIITITVFHFFEQLKDPVEHNDKKPILLYKLANVSIIRSFIKKNLNNNPNKVRKQQKMLRRMGYTYGIDVFLLKRLIYAVIGFCVGMIIVIAACRFEKNIVITSVYDLYDVIPYGNKLITEKALSEIIIECRGKPEDVLIEKLKHSGITSDEAIRNIVEKVAQKYFDYENSYIKWHEILILFIVTILFYFYPYLFLLYQHQFLKDYMDEEVICFKSILSMQVNVKGICVIELLESIEMFARVFKPAIQNCINNVLCDEKKALTDLKEIEPYPPFTRLIDCFLICDKMEAAKAFDEVIEDIKYFQDMYSLELDIMMKRKSDMAELISFLPGAFILFFYLIIPFISAGMQMFEASFKGNLGSTI